MPELFRSGEGERKGDVPAKRGESSHDNAQDAIPCHVCDPGAREVCKNGVWEGPVSQRVGAEQSRDKIREGSSRRFHIPGPEGSRGLLAPEKHRKLARGQSDGRSQSYDWIIGGQESPAPEEEIPQGRSSGRRKSGRDCDVQRVVLPRGFQPPSPDEKGVPAVVWHPSSLSE